MANTPVDVWLSVPLLRRARLAIVVASEWVEMMAPFEWLYESFAGTGKDVSTSADALCFGGSGCDLQGCKG
jgi:hypothetical protein